MSRPKTSTEEKIRWLLDNQSMWSGYPRPKQPHRLSHREYLLREMKRAGLYAGDIKAPEAQIGYLINVARKERAKLQLA